jgi:DNA-binding response OmpR family regulator
MRLLAIGVSGDIREQVVLALQLRWPELQLDFVPTGAEGVEAARRRSPDVIMLQRTFRDLELDDVIRSIRRHTDKPLIVWGTEQGEMEAVRALETGADEYVRPQVGLMELVARTLALLRRAQLFPSSESAAVAVSGDLRVNPKTMQATISESDLSLTPTEFKLLLALMRNRGSVVSRRYLEQNIWDNRTDAQSLVKKYVQRLRRKLGDNSEQPHWIANVPGVGYRFVGPAEPSGAASTQRVPLPPARAAAQ